MASEKNKNVQRAHLLLGAYWLYMLYRGKRVPEATLDVLKIQRNSLIKEYSERKSAQQGKGRSCRRRASNGTVPGKVPRAHSENGKDGEDP